MSRYPLAVLLAALLVAPPLAAEPLTLRYSATWAGLPAGEVYLRLAEAPSVARAQIEIRTEGLPRWLTRFRARGISEGKVAADGLAAPVRYDATYDLRSRKDKRISMRFVSRGGGVVAERGVEDSSEFFIVPPAQRTDVVDPLAALSRMREALRSGLAQRGGLKIPIFDGKRRFDVEEHALTAEMRQIGDAAVPVLHLEFVMVPIAGFKDNDPEGNPDATPRRLDVLFSNDGNVIPLRMEVTVAWLTMVVRLDHQCSAATPCAVAFD